ncbi:hypothetical protein T484DRAFT_1787681 [Baffinella frigidus]|nr:hypothetical protein T484DRAFT_1787681 [Cryptophyta sp. CCMP2293]
MDCDEMQAVPRKFSLRGELMHAFISYCASTEGPAGNRLADLVAAKIRSMSTSTHLDLQIPQYGWGIWMKGFKRQVPFRPEEAKVYLDHECVLNGQSWVESVVLGLEASMVFVPLLSWTEADEGSLGQLSLLGVDGSDRADNLLLELIIATALRDEPGAAVQAILPVLIGHPRPAAEGGGFGSFPFYKLARLSDEPSRATNERAGVVLRQLGLGEDSVQTVLGRSVKQVVELAIRNQGCQASEWGDVEGVAAQCGARVLRTVLQEMRRLRSDHRYFEYGTLMGSEVLQWLQGANLRSYAPLFIHNSLISLEHVALLTPDRLSKIADEHEEFYRSYRHAEMGGRNGDMGELKKLELAHVKLLHKTPARCFGLLT